MRKQIKSLIFYGILLLSIPFSAMAVEVFIDGLRYSVDENQEEDMLGGRTSNFWKTYGGKYQTITDKAVNITGDLEFQDEIKPDGATCAVGEILKRTGADNWDCAADDDSGGAGGYPDYLGQIGDVSTNTPMISGEILHYDGTNWVSSSTLFVNATTGDVSIGTTTSCHKLCVDGSIRTTDTFYGNTWTSYDGDSMNIKPSGDEDDYLSFKTIANRPTTKIEGGPFYFFESSSSYFTGLSMRKDDTHSGSIIYYKQEDQFGLSSKDPIVFKTSGDYDNYVRICNANSIPELSVASSSGFKINAGGTNSLLLNHAGGNVGIGTESPDESLSVVGNIRADGAGTASSYMMLNDTSGKATALGAGNSNSIFMFDETGGFQIQARTKAEILAGSGNSADGKLVILANDNVGIGTTSPLSKFSMNSGTNGFRIDSSGIVQQGTWQGTALTDAYVSNILTVDGYLSDTGDIGTGVYDFGGADSFEIPNNTNLTIDANGEVYVNTTSASSSLRYYDGTAERALYPISEKTISIASSTLNNYAGQTASTTIPLGVASIHGETWTEISCYTDAGTVEVEFGDGTNWIDYQTLSTALTTDSSLSNNTFTRYEKRYIRIGQASSLGTLSCVVSIRKNAD